MKYYFCIVLFLGLVFLNACSFFTKEIDRDIPPGEPIAILGFISPQDTVIRIRVRWTEPSTGFVPDNRDILDDVTDAHVTLSNGEDEIDLIYEPFRDYTASAQDFPIESGKTYTLSVKQGTQINALAQCTVPPNQVDTSKVIYLPQNDNFDLIIRWQDIPGRENFYALFEIVSRFEGGNAPGVIASEQFHRGYTDQNNDGGLFTSPVLHYTQCEEPSFGSFFCRDVFIANVDFNYHQYHEDLETLMRTRDSPFTEPFNLHSNIEGGTGVFAAMNYVRIRRLSE